MIPKSFEYVCPTSLDQAVSYLDRFGSNCKVLAGGQSLLPLMKLRLASPKYLVDITRISDLEYIRETNDGKFLTIGPLTRHHAIEKSDLVKKKAQIMTEAASMIGDPQVRNSGTIGGSLVHADPAADWPAVMIALDSTLKVVSSLGEREISAENFFVDSLTTAMESKELLTEIRVPLSEWESSASIRTGGAYEKLERKTQDFATVGVAAQISIDSTSKTCSKVGIGLASVAEKTIRAKKAEEILIGTPVTRSKIEEAAEAASQESRPTDDLLRGSAEYKKAMTRVFTERALTRALSHATKV